MEKKLNKILNWFCDTYNLYCLMLVLIGVVAAVALVRQGRQLYYSSVEESTVKESTVKEVKVIDCDYRLVEIEEGGVIYIDSYSGLTPYYSPNGKLCHLVDGEVVEVE